MPFVELKGISKRFGNVIAVNDFSLMVGKGEFIGLLGASGSGKTTILRIIAGYEYPTEGRVFIDGKDITDLSPDKRNIGMVFQNYCLFPHMTVFNNIAFGLKMRKVKRSIIKQIVSEVLELVHLQGLEARYPRELSGGQQQRVALARSLAIKPIILLLDEPLSNLDHKLRLEMREELKRIQKETGLTTIFVTHDQEEALGMSSKVALINEGKLIQVDSPAKIYQNPQSDFVALFFGRSNSFRGVIKDITEHEMIFSTDNEEKLTLPKLSGFRQGQRVVVFVRSENIRVSEEKKAENSLFGQIISAIYLGSSMEYICKIGESRIIAKLQAGIKDELLPVNKTVWIGFNKEDCLIFPEEGF